MEDSNDERGVVCTIELSSTCNFCNMHEDVGLLYGYLIREIN
jgi:hypothetical protein